jgi:hypothetical protein
MPLTSPPHSEQSAVQHKIVQPNVTYVALTLPPREPSASEDSVVLCIGADSIRLTPSDFHQLVGCLLDADRKVFPDARE